MPLPTPRPGHHLKYYLFSLARDSAQQHSINKAATETNLARPTAFQSSATDECELCDHRRRQGFRVIDPLFAIFSGLVTRIH
jgi:hypothetical protein